jgi:hypothetical protein
LLFRRRKWIRFSPFQSVIFTAIDTAQSGSANYGLSGSVADPGRLFRILIFVYLGFLIQKYQQKRGVKKNLLSYLFL